MPALVRRAFDAVDADAVRSLTEILVGEGAFTTAGALVFPVLLDGLAGSTAAHLRARLLVDVLWGTEAFSARGIDPARRRGKPARVILDAARAAVPRLIGTLEADDPGARGGAALLLGALRVTEAAPVLGTVLANEPRDDVRTALLFGLAGCGGGPASWGPFLADPVVEVRLAASLAAFVVSGDDAPDIALVQLAAWPRLRYEAPGFPLPASFGSLVVHDVLNSGCPRAIGFVTQALLHEVDRWLAAGRGSTGWGAVIGDLAALLVCHVPDPTVPFAGLPPLAQQVVRRTVHRDFGTRPIFGEQGLPPSLAARRRWIGDPDPADTLPVDDPLRTVLTFETSFDELPPPIRATTDTVRAALDALPLDRAKSWAEAHLARRTRYPGATRAPNGACVLLALERLDDAALERCCVRDREPILAALSIEDPRGPALLARLPMPRRVAVWRDHAEHVNPRVGLARALALAPVCPTPEVALELVARALLAGDPGTLHATLDQLGPAGDAARSVLAALVSTGG